MERHIPRPGEKYLHFKGKQYQILCVAQHSETKEPLVIYQALYGGFTCYARPLGMFMEEVDHRKYPNVLQKFRFELSESKAQTVWDETKAESCHGEIAKQDDDAGDTPEAKPPGHCESKEAGKEGVPEETDAKYNRQPENTDTETDGEERANPMLLQFLDAETLEEKCQVLKMLEGTITDRLIDDFAVALDLVIPEGSLSERYFQLLSSVRTMQRFENNRFR